MEKRGRFEYQLQNFDFRKSRTAIADFNMGWFERQLGDLLIKFAPR